jgi:hypothetical protein
MRVGCERFLVRKSCMGKYFACPSESDVTGSRGWSRANCSCTKKALPPKRIATPKKYRANIDVGVQVVRGDEISTNLVASTRADVCVEFFGVDSFSMDFHAPVGVGPDSDTYFSC